MSDPTAGKLTCRECGSEIDAGAGTCPECGVRQPGTPRLPVVDRTDGVREFLYVGVALGIAALHVLPFIFGPLAILSGVFGMVTGRLKAGAGVVAWGVIATIVGTPPGTMP